MGVFDRDFVIAFIIKLLISGAATKEFLSKPASPVKKIVGSNVSFHWTYNVSDSLKKKFEGLTWKEAPSAGAQTIIGVSSSGVPDLSAAPPKYKGRIMWTGNTTAFVASFVLLNVSLDDENEYGIEISFGLFDKLSDTYNLVVLVPARNVMVTPNCIRKNTSKAATFVCTAEGAPVPKFTWYKDPNPSDIKLESKGSIEIRDKGRSSSLTLRNLNSTDTGNYKCKANNSIGEGIALGILEVLFCEAQKGVPSVYEIPVKDGQPELLSCPVTGNPHPEIKWTLPGGAIISSTSTNLVVEPGDEKGTYQCSACGQSFSFELTVEAPGNCCVAAIILGVLAGLFFISTVVLTVLLCQARAALRRARQGIGDKVGQDGKDEL